jgi:hypothetical protein
MILRVEGSSIGLSSADPDPVDSLNERVEKKNEGSNIGEENVLKVQDHQAQTCRPSPVYKPETQAEARLRIGWDRLTIPWRRRCE